MDKTEILKQIDRYRKGLLTEAEKDKLWEQFLKSPELLEWLEIEVTALDHYRSKSDGSKNEE